MAFQRPRVPRPPVVEDRSLYRWLQQLADAVNQGLEFLENNGTKGVGVGNFIAFDYPGEFNPVTDSDKAILFISTGGDLTIRYGNGTANTIDFD